MTGDPLEGLALPPGDPEALEAMAARMGQWARRVAESDSRQSAAVASMTSSQWKGSGADSAHSAAAEVVAGYRTAGENIGSAMAVISRCATEWAEARSLFLSARRLADEAAISEAACAAGGLSSSPTDTASRARQIAVSAIDDFEAASRRAATALEHLTRDTESRPAFLSPHGRSWYDAPFRWARRSWEATSHLAGDLASDPAKWTRLVSDALQVGGGAALTGISVTGFGTGVLLDASGIGAPVGVPLDAVSLLGIGVGSGLTMHGAMDGFDALDGGGGSGGSGLGSGGGASGDGTGSLEGRSGYVVKDADDKAVTDIDKIEGGVLWEQKSAAGALDDQTWIRKQVVEKFYNYMRARELLPGYQDAPIGFEFTQSNVYPPFRLAVESAVDALRVANPNVTIYLRWAS